MEKSFKFYIPLKKNTINNDFLEGVASTLSVDKDEEKMSEIALENMRKDILSLGINLFGNHEHNWENTLGAISTAEIKNKSLHIGIKLDDPTTNPKIPMLLNKLKRGIKLGLSVGGSVVKERFEHDDSVGKRIKVIDKVKLYEVSVVGIPSNGESFMSIPNQITKSLNNTSFPHNCPACNNHILNKKCRVCLWQK